MRKSLVAPLVHAVRIYLLNQYRKSCIKPSGAYSISDTLEGVNREGAYSQNQMIHGFRETMDDKDIYIYI